MIGNKAQSIEIDVIDCTLGLGVPTPDWATAVGMALRALGDLGAGTVTFKDADVALYASKNRGRAQLTLFSDALLAPLRFRRTLD